MAFAGLAAVLTAIPGPAVVLIMKSSLISGRRRAAMTAFGVFTGDLVWVATSLLGLTALLVAYRPAFEVLRFLGAAYLIYLGLRLALRGFALPNTDRSTPVVRSTGAQRRGFTEGVLCELSNPKTLLVFTSLIPPFVPVGGGPGDVALFGALFATTGLVVCVVYAAVLGHTGERIVRPRLADRLLRGSGGLLTVFGGALAVEGVREL